MQRSRTRCIRWVVLVSLATAGVLGFAYGPYQGKQTGEPALLRQLLGQLRRGEVVVADRYYCSYFMVALLLACGVDVVLRLHQRRRYDFRRGRRFIEWLTLPRGAVVSRIGLRHD